LGETKVKPLKTLTKDARVGIYDSEFVARVYSNMIVVISPYVKWVGNTGGYAEYRDTIRDEEIILKVLKSLEDEDEDAAWDYIHHATDDITRYGNWYCY